MADDDYKYIYTKRHVYRLPRDAQGIPIEEVYPGAEMPAFLKGALVYDTPRGRIIARQESAERDGDAEARDTADARRPAAERSVLPAKPETPPPRQQDNPLRFFRKDAPARERPRDRDDLER